MLYKALRQLLVICLFLTGTAAWAYGAGNARRANKLYLEKRYDEALELYDKALEKKPNDRSVQYNRAAALYRKREFGKAAKAFLKSLAGVDEGMEEKAIYNVGNSEYRLGESAEKQDPNSAMKNYKKALEYYKRSMMVSPEDRAAKYNYEFTLKKMKESQEQQQEQQEQQDQQEQDKEKDQQEQQQQQDEQQEQEQKEQQEQQDEQQEQKQQEREDQEQQKEEQKQQEPDTMERPEEELSEEETEMLLRSQDEEEARHRSEMGKKKGKGRPPVVRNW